MTGAVSGPADWTSGPSGETAPGTAGAAGTPSPEFLESLYRAMLHGIGPTGWWPAETLYEIMVGAVLTQNTAWDNVDRSLHALRNAGMLQPHAIAEAEQRVVQELIRPSGFHRNKSRALIELSRWYVARCDADPQTVADVPDAELRRELLGLFGVGGETADDLMLYVFSRRAFVADTYARRLFAFLGWTPPAGYPKFHDAMLPAVVQTGLTVADLKEFHGLIDEFGKTWRNDDAKGESFLSGWRGRLAG